MVTKLCSIPKFSLWLENERKKTFKDANTADFRKSEKLLKSTRKKQQIHKFETRKLV